MDAGTAGVPFPSWTTTEARLADLFVRRLRRLLIIRDDHASRLNGGGLRLVDQAIYSTYCDCIEVGVEIEARSLLKGPRAPCM